MTPLIAALDDAALKLLQYAMAEDNVPRPPDPFAGAEDPEPPPDKVSLADRVRAFDAAAGWAKVRGDLVPPEKEAPKFHAIVERFNGKQRRASGRRGASAIAEEDAAG